MEKTSKEELERMAKVAYPDSDYASNAVFVENNRIAWSKGFRAAESMPNDACEFAEWCDDNLIRDFSDTWSFTAKYKLSHNDGAYKRFYTTAELYIKFKSIKQEGSVDPH